MKITKSRLILGSFITFAFGTFPLSWAGRLSIGTYALNVHGISEEAIYSQNMPRRFDDGARFVPNPELFLKYRGTSHQFVTAIGQDCYSQPAAYLSWGLYRPLSSGVDYGFIVGAYYRKTRMMEYKGETRSIKEFYTVDLGGGNQFVPMPMATLSMEFPLGRTTSLGMNIGSNFFVTHLVAVLTFDVSGWERSSSVSTAQGQLDSLL